MKRDLKKGKSVLKALLGSTWLYYHVAAARFFLKVIIVFLPANTLLDLMVFTMGIFA